RRLVRPDLPFLAGDRERAAAVALGGDDGHALQLAGAVAVDRLLLKGDVDAFTRLRERLQHAVGGLDDRRPVGLVDRVRHWRRIARLQLPRDERREQNAADGDDEAGPTLPAGHTNGMATG